MYESPIQMITDDIIKDIVQKQDGYLMEAVHRVGFNIDKDELVKALNYDRDQYEKGYADGRSARDSEIVRCRECKYYEETDARIGTCLLTVCGANIDGFCAWAEKGET